MTLVLARIWVTLGIFLITAFGVRLSWCCYRPGLKGPGPLEALLGGAIVVWFVLGASWLVWTT